MLYRINVRLGEWDLSSPGRDCVTSNGIQICNQQEVNVGVEETIPHPSYTDRDTNKAPDIALIRLNRPVQFTGKNNT